MEMSMTPEQHLTAILTWMATRHTETLEEMATLRAELKDARQRLIWRDERIAALSNTEKVTEHTETVSPLL
jgi:hypothetical protein